MLQDIGIGANRIMEIDEINEQKIQILHTFTSDESEKISKYIRQAPRQIDDMLDRIVKLI